MSLHQYQTQVNKDKYFFLLANVSTLTADNIIAKNISTLALQTGQLQATEGLISTLRVTDYISTNHLDANRLDTYTLSSQNLEANYAFISEATVLGGFISSLVTNNVILDGNSLDTGGAGAGATLLLNGYPIVTAALSSFSSLSDWAYFPAASTLQMSMNSIANAGNITCMNINSQNIYNALTVQTDSLSALTSLTSPSGVITNLRATNFSTTNAVTSNLTVGTAATIPNLSTTTTLGNVARFQGLSSFSVSTGSLTATSINGQPYAPASNWSQYAATSAVNMNGFALTNTTGQTFSITPTSNINITASNGNLVANYPITMTAGDITVTADSGADVGGNATINVVAQNGNRGRVNITANPGFAGVQGEVAITANGGTTPLGVGLGGKIDIVANTPIGLSNLTSVVNLNAAGINSYAGAIPPLASAAGFQFIYGTGGVNICSGLPPFLPNVVGTTYIYGTTGVEIPSQAYMSGIEPYWNGLTTPPDLLISGRYIIPNLAQVCLNLSNVRNLDFQSNVATYMSNCDNISMSANGSITTSNLVTTVGTLGTSGFTTLNGTTINSGAVNTNTLVASNSVTSPLVSTNKVNLSTINDFASFGSKSIRVNGDVAQVQLYNDNPGGIGTNLNLLSRVAYTEIQSFNSNFTTPRPLAIKADYVSTTSLLVSTINGQSLPYAYGAFTANTAQTIGTDLAISTILDTTEASAGGISIVGGTGTKVAVSTTGIYRILASPQFDTTSGGQNTVDFWLAKNGVNIPRSASKLTIQNNGEIFTSVEVILPMDAQDYVETLFTSTDINMTLNTFAATGVVPEVPALIFNINKIAE